MIRCIGWESGRSFGLITAIFIFKFWAGFFCGRQFDVKLYLDLKIFQKLMDMGLCETLGVSFDVNL